MREAPHVLGIVLAGGEGKRLYPLTADRAKPAVPFGGGYRLIDFVLSNLVNARFLRICVLTQYKSHSLDRHISQNWRLSGLAGEYITPVPAQQRLGPRWYTGSADAIYQSMNLIYDEDPDYIVIFGADHVYRMDPEQMRPAAHRERRGRHGGRHSGAAGRGPAFGCIDADDSGRIRGWVEKPADPPGTPDDPEMTFASMGNYIFTTKVLIDAIRADADDDDSDHDMGGDIIPRLVADGMAVGVRLRRQRGARRHRARPRLLARRRHPRTRSTTRTWIWCRCTRSSTCTTSAGRSGRRGEPGTRQVRQRRVRAGVGRRCGQHHFGGLGAQFGAVVERRHRRRRDRRGQRAAARGAHRARSGGPRTAILDKNVVVGPGEMVGVDLDKDRERFTVSSGGVVAVGKGVWI